MRSPLALLFTFLALLAAGCGGGEIEAEEVPGAPPALTVTSDDDIGTGAADGAADADAETDTADPEATIDPNSAVVPEDDASGGAVAPEATAVPTPAAEEPAADSGAQFEDFCEQNAGAC